MKLLFTVLFTLLSAMAGAQTVILSQSFYKLYKGSSDFGSMKDLPAFSNWGFNNHCYAMKEDYMFVGEGNDPEQALGIVTTPALEINGNATLLIKTKRSRSSVVPRFRVSVIGGEIVGATDYTVGDGDEYRPSAILLKNLTPTSKIIIEGIYGKFVLKTIKVYAINDAIFYESFDYMDFPAGLTDFAYREIAENGLCDNSEVTELTEIYQAKNNIHLRYKNASSYVLSAIPIADNSDALLTFNLSIFGNSSNGEISLSCSDDTEIASFDVSGLEKDVSADQNKWTLTGDYSNWHDCKIGLMGISSSSVLTISGYYINMDEVLVRPVCILDEKENNDNKASALSNVMLIRTLTPNTWCPLCLPFNVTQSQMEDAMETTCELRTLTDIRGGVFIFDKVTSVSAGTPFLIKVNTLVENPVFTGVTVVDTPAATATGSAMGYSFVGTYSPVSLNTNGTHLFLDKEGNLCQPDLEEGYNRLNGLRAYFVVPASATEARVFISDATANVSRSSITSTTHHKTYDLSGRQANSTYSKGLHICNGRKTLTR